MSKKNTSQRRQQRPTPRRVAPMVRKSPGDSWYLRLIRGLSSAAGDESGKGRSISALNLTKLGSRCRRYFLSLGRGSKVLVVIAILIALMVLFNAIKLINKTEATYQTWRYSVQTSDILAGNQTRRLSDAIIAEAKVSLRSSPLDPERLEPSKSNQAQFATETTRAPTTAALDALPAGKRPKPPAVGAGVGGDYQVRVKVRSGESLTSILSRHQVDHQMIHRLSKLPEVGRYLRRIQPGKEIKMHFGGNDRLQSLTYQLSRQQYVDVKHRDNKLIAKLKDYPVEIRQAFASGEIKSSLFLSGRRAGLTDKTITEFARIFSWDIDFSYDIRRGDKFEVLYQQKFINNKFIGSGAILVARLYNRSRWLEGYRFKRKGRPEYFNRAGKNLRRAFLRNPLDPSLISSHFSHKRLHPILKIYRPHRGVDYAAPTNTPIRATGFGAVKFRGRKKGYGKVVIISHAGRYETLYAHMNRFSKKIRRGVKVNQGEVIGYVGSTGYATGPHLHYEFRVNGKHRDPQKVELPRSESLQGEEMSRYLRRFKALEVRLIAQRERYRIGPKLTRSDQLADVESDR